MAASADRRCSDSRDGCGAHERAQIVQASQPCRENPAVAHAVLAGNRELCSASRRPLNNVESVPKSHTSQATQIASGRPYFARFVPNEFFPGSADQLGMLAQPLTWCG